MELIQLIHDSVFHLATTPWSVLGDSWQHYSLVEWPLLAQAAQQFDTDVFAGTRAWFANFIETGQVWALIIGIIVGYAFRSFTSYG
jgi:hypothetical protein